MLFTVQQVTLVVLLISDLLFPLETFVRSSRTGQKGHFYEVLKMYNNLVFLLSAVHASDIITIIILFHFTSIIRLMFEVRA